MPLAVNVQISNTDKQQLAPFSVPYILKKIYLSLVLAACVTLCLTCKLQLLQLGVCSHAPLGIAC